MKVFVITSIIGQDPIKAAAILGRACSGLTHAGHTPTHNLSEIQFLQETAPGEADVLRKAYLGIDQSEAVLLVMQPDTSNDDALAAFGYAWGKGKTLMVAYPAGHFTPVAKLASVAIQYTDLDDLGVKVAGLHR
ncbi:MAG: hypothetical protein ABIA93_01480 [Candidatus Woesearchaeota archaeon]